MQGLVNEPVHCNPSKRFKDMVGTRKGCLEIFYHREGDRYKGSLERADKLRDCRSVEKNSCRLRGCISRYPLLKAGCSENIAALLLVLGDLIRKYKTNGNFHSRGEIGEGRAKRQSG